MKKPLLLFPLCCWGHYASACILCNREVQQAIANSTFFPNLLTMLSAFFVLAGTVVGLTALASTRHKRRVGAYPHPKEQPANPVPLTSAAMVLGIGIGGFIDGIVFHQVLQFHEMLSNKIPPVDYVTKSVNMFWDGIFHFFTLLVVLTGIVLLYKLLHRTDIDRSGRLLAGGMLLGWGLFNLIEGIIDHHILKLHNVNESSTNPERWNYGFLGISLLLIIIGYFLAHKKKNSPLIYSTYVSPEM